MSTIARTSFDLWLARLVISRNWPGLASRDWITFSCPFIAVPCQWEPQDSPLALPSVSPFARASDHGEVNFLSGHLQGYWSMGCPLGQTLRQGDEGSARYRVMSGFPEE